MTITDMNKINFKKKDGVVTWIEGRGAQCTYVGEPKPFLMDLEENIYRCTLLEWMDPPKGFTKIKGFFG